MARSTYGTRLEALIANPAISQRDKAFAESLHSFYTSKRRLTAGRARCVKQMEERYSPEKLAAALAKGGAMLERLNAVCERTEPKSWGRGFVNSLQGQIMAGRELSEKQIKTLEKIEAENSDDAIATRATWKQDYRAGVDADWGTAPVIVAQVAALYYKAAGYFQGLVSSILTDEGFVPTVEQYNKITKNKFAVKVLAAYFADPKFAPGSLVQFGATAPAHMRRLPPCVVIKANAAPITSAAKGAKVYSVLPMGSAKTVFCEERHLKKARKVGGKK
jgi:hypothetical protein